MTHHETLVAEQILMLKPAFEKAVKTSIIFSMLTIGMIVASGPLLG